MNKEIRIRPTPGPLPNWEGVDYLAILPRASLADSLCPGLLSVAPTGLQYAAPSGAWNQYGEGAKPQRHKGTEPNGQAKSKERPPLPDPPPPRGGEGDGGVLESWRRSRPRARDSLLILGVY